MIKMKNARWKLVDRMFWKLMISSTVIEFSLMGASFIDGLFISRFLGPDAMAGQGIALPIYSIVGMISGLIAGGMLITSSQHLGRGNIEKVNQFFSQSLIVGGVISIILMIPVLLFSEPFAVLLGASGNASNLVSLTADYLFGFGVGIPAQILTAILTSAIQMDSGRKRILTGAIICAVADVILDIAAIQLKLGLLGIGLATSISQYINLLYQCMHFRRKDRMLHLVRPNVSFTDFLQMLSNGTEKAARRATNIVRPIILNSIIIAYGGSMAMSALSIRNNLCNFTGIVGMGIASAIAMLTSLFYGEINKEAIWRVKICGWKAAILSSSVICAILLLFAEPIAHMYLTEVDEIFHLVVFSICILALQTLIQTILKNRIFYLQAISKKINMNVLLFSSQLIVILLSAFLLGNWFGVYGVLSSFLVSDVLSLVGIYIFYQILFRKVLVPVQDMLNLPSNFDLQPGDVISLDIRNMEDVSVAAEQIQLFCKGHKYDSKLAFYAALTFEEIASNIIQYGFPMNREKEPMIDLRVVALDNMLTIRICDDCPNFDIRKRIVEINQNTTDPLSNLGIRITGKCAKELSYAYTYETNNIIISYSDPKTAFRV